MEHSQEGVVIGSSSVELITRAVVVANTTFVPLQVATALAVIVPVPVGYVLLPFPSNIAAKMPPSSSIVIEPQLSAAVRS
jgi:hypothetical protein